MNSHPFNIVIASLCVIVLVVLTPLIGIATGIDSTITITLASIAGLVLGGCMCKAPFPPFSTLRTELRTLKHGPGPSGFKIRVGIGKTQMDLSCLDNTTACTIGPELVTDLDALLIADPFVITHGDRAWLFFEAMERKSRKGVICAAWSEDGEQWTYHGKVLEESFHLSYPHIIQHDGEIWMIPESCHDYSVRLYRADNFPDQWTHTDTLLSGYCFCDNTTFIKGDTWWLLSSIGNDHLNAYSAPCLHGPWSPHPQNPVIRTGPRDSRMAGSVIRDGEKTIRIAQDCVERYGHFLRGYEINELTDTHFEEQELPESPLLQPSPNSWRTSGCHHLAQTQFKGKWLIVSDGY